MMKFFRKYNKTLLAVFMVLLMVVFVGGPALVSLVTPTANAAIGESRFGPIKQFDQSQARATTKLLQYMGYDYRFFAGLGKPLQPIDWILLTREAADLGATADAAAIESWLLQSAGPDQLSGRDQVEILARRLDVKTDHIRAAIGELLSVQMAQLAISSASVPSEAEVRSVALRILDSVSVDTVVLPAAAFVDPDETFTAEQMKAQWSSLRDVEPGAGLNFGYYVPPKLAVQYMKIDPRRIAEDIGIANLESKARRLYDRERAGNPLFRRPQEPQDAAAVEEEGPPEEKPPYLDWDEAKEAAIALVKENQSRDAAVNLAQWLREYDAERWIDADRDKETRYKITPEEVQDEEYYREMLEHVPATIGFPNAVTVTRTDFFASDEADDVPEIGKATYDTQRFIPLRLGSLAFRSAPIIPEIPDDSGADRAEFLALYQTCSHLLTDEDDNVYLFRIVEAQPGHPSESVEEVKDRVEEDLRLLAGLDRAEAVSEGLRSCSPEIPLREAFDSDESLRDLQADGQGVGFHEATDITRITIGQVFYSTPSTDTLVSFGVGRVPNDVVERWFELEDAYERTEMFKLEDRATILVAEWKSRQPATHEDFEDMHEQLVQQITDRRTREAATDWYSADNIRARNGYERIN
ncbi:MAG: hypothetical protein IIB57_04335 [Planctomycetes bacterium]|nr:hypothetical protein [Planctomycetota bacterium]